MECMCGTGVWHKGIDVSAEVVYTLYRSENRFWEPPYSPRNVYGKLGTRTVATSALGYQHNHQWDTHNLYGIAEGIVTARAVASITGQRPFVLSRCGFFHSFCTTFLLSLFREIL